MGGLPNDIDLALNKFFTIDVTPKVYVSYFDPNGPANMEASAAAIKPGTPVFLVVGTRDIPLIKEVNTRIFAALPSHAGNKHLILEGGHLNIVSDASGEIVAWIKNVK